jgi:ABC-type antimicrobial peptide transport system permease subunit
MAAKITPPQLARWIFKLMFTKGEQYQVLTPLDEAHQDICQREGSASAFRWYWLQLLKALPDFAKKTLIRRAIMIKSTLKFSFRNLKKYPFFSMINTMGLTISMSCFILIFLWISHELSYDAFHENFKRIYRVGNYDIDDNDDIYYAVTSGPLAGVLKEKFPEVEQTVRVADHQGWLEYGSKKFRENSILCAGPAFLEVFTFPLLRGDHRTALMDMNSILLSEQMAKKYFTDGDAMHKILRLDAKHDMVVTGIFRNVPGNSNLKFHFLIPFLKLRDLNQTYKKVLDKFDYNNFFTYILLKKGTNYDSINQKIENLPLTFEANSKNRLVLQPIEDIHLRSNFSYDRLSADRGDIKYVYILSVIAAFILIIAFLNYIGLTTARSGDRLKEVGLKKLLGAQKSSIVNQFISETLLISLLSLGFSLLLVVTFLPYFNHISGKNLSLAALVNGTIIWQILMVVGLTAIISGTYPAVIISSFHPLKAIRGTLSSSPSRPTFRKILVVVQFSLSVMLIIATFFIHQQLNFMKNKPFSFKKNQILHFKVKDDLIKKLALVKNEMQKIPGVQGLTTTNLYSEQLPQSYLRKWQGKTGDAMISTFFFYVDYQTPGIFNLEMANGRFFSSKFPSDLSEAVVVNEAAIKAMGMESPIGKVLYLGKSPRKIIGVVKDFNYRSFRFSINPLVFYCTTYPRRYLNLMIEPQNTNTILAQLKRIWKKNAGGVPFAYQFIEDRYLDSYDSEERIASLMRGFTFLAFLVASLGLFGLASYLSQQKTKEIGIRKVLGADVTKIVGMLSAEYFILVVLANIIAWPVTYIFVKSWLNNFAYRVPIGMMTFILSGILTLIMALVSVGYQSIKAARTDPAITLKYE